MNWRVRMILIAWVMCCVAPSASAQEPGSFFRFLVPALDDPVGAAKFLKEQFASLDKQLGRVNRELVQQQAAYQARLDEAIPRLRFYEIYSGSAIGALWTKAQDPVGVIASMELLERVGKEDLAALTWLETVKGDLQDKEASLRRYRALLEAFQRGVEARQNLLANVPAEWHTRKDEFVITSINDSWNDSVRDLAIVPYFTGLGGHLSPQLGGEQGLLTEASPSSWTVSEDHLNSVLEESKFIRAPRFYVRADHIYFSARAEVPTGGRLNSYQVVIVGWLNRVARSAVQYSLEAVYLDGVPIDVYDPLLRTPMILGQFLRLDFSPLLSSEQKLGVEQHNGYLYFEACEENNVLVSVQELKSLSSCSTWRSFRQGGGTRREVS